jgi:hypothetical protein
VPGLDSLDVDFRGAHATQFGFGHGRACGLWLRRHQIVHQPPLLVDVAVDGKGRLPRGRIELLPLLSAHRSFSSAIRRTGSA